MTTTSILTMVATDKEGKPIKVPGVLPETDEEKALFKEANTRKERRLKIKDSMRGG